MVYMKEIIGSCFKEKKDLFHLLLLVEIKKLKIDMDIDFNLILLHIQIKNFMIYNLFKQQIKNITVKYLLWKNIM